MMNDEIDSTRHSYSKNHLPWQYIKILTPMTPKTVTPKPPMTPTLVHR
jgi:hypothetical protein